MAASPEYEGGDVTRSSPDGPADGPAHASSASAPSISPAPLASPPALARGSVPKQKNTLSFQQCLTFSPGAFFGDGGKTPRRTLKAGGRGGKAKSTAQPPEPVQHI